CGQAAARRRWKQMSTGPNLSGHKYGLVYPGVGWLLFKDEAVVPEDLIFDVNYLGGNMPTYTLNFSRGSAMIVAQYYNFLRLGKTGYRHIVHNMMKVSTVIEEGLLKTGVFHLLGTRRMEPVISIALKAPCNYTVYDISAALRAHGWVVPAYSLPENAEHIDCLRIVVKENMSLTLAKAFLTAVHAVINQLQTTKQPIHDSPRKGKFLSH
ncbi:MAG: pyridoxal-dependent decarboxylase, partial [Legionellaceae bacterium]|nr:pyridoxal-dependent decarboxylase [Legionellaceae bacterium]